MMVSACLIGPAVRMLPFLRVVVVATTALPAVQLSLGTAGAAGRPLRLAARLDLAAAALAD